MTASEPNDRLWNLLPSTLRGEDLERGSALRSLLAIISEQVDAVEENVRDLYDDEFVETSAAWVVPYLAALVANDVIYDELHAGGAETSTALFTDLEGHDLRPPVAARMRADVGRTIHYRRRKGTLAVIEELARNVTGWPIHAAEGFEELGWTQHLEHRRQQASMADLRRPRISERANGPFDGLSHTVDVRILRQHEGWPNVRTIAIHAWRLRSDPVIWSTAKKASGAAFGWTFSPLGQPTPLFTPDLTEQAAAGLVRADQVPEAITRTRFSADLRAYRELAPPPSRVQATELYGEFSAVGAGAAPPLAPDAAFFIYADAGAGTPVSGIGPAVAPNAPPSTFAPQVRCAQLVPWPAQPPEQVVLVDVVAGRILFGAGFAAQPSQVRVSYHVPAPAAHGGGGYGRRAWLVPRDPAVERRAVSTRPGVAPGPGYASTHSTLTGALGAWVVGGRRDCVIEILDSGTYDLPTLIQLPKAGRLVIQAADRERPCLSGGTGVLQVDVSAPPTDRDVEACLTLSGLLVAGAVDVIGPLRRLRLWHTTLVPGRQLNEDGSAPAARPSIAVGANAGLRLRIEIAFSILGPLTVPPEADGIWLLDSVIDAISGDAAPAVCGPAFVPTAVGPPLHAERSTILGVVDVAALDASECILTGMVRSQRTQEGCVRFSYLPTGSVTPRRYRCQPELAASEAVDAALEHDPALTPAQRSAIAAGVAQTVVPSFTARSYGRPAYIQLRAGCPPEITTGAEDGSEMGALCHLKQAQRAGNLTLRLSEYLPFGLDAGLVFVT